MGKRPMKQVATIQFADAETGEIDEIFIMVKGGEISLALSQQTDGDVELFLRPEDCRRVIDALQRALAASEQQM